MNPARPLVVVVTGSECTGKTTLALELAEWLGAPCSREFARKYVDRKRAPLTGADVEPIARGQVSGEDAALARAVDVVVKDTDLVSTVVYAYDYYDAGPAWIEREARARLGDLYLLLHPDVPWVADGLQRDRPADRERLHGLFSSRLASYGARVTDITGDWPARRALAFQAVSTLLSSRGQIRL